MKTRCPKCGGSEWATVFYGNKAAYVGVKCWSGRGRIGGCDWTKMFSRRSLIALAAKRGGKS